MFSKDGSDLVDIVCAILQHGGQEQFRDIAENLDTQLDTPLGYRPRYTATVLTWLRGAVDQYSRPGRSPSACSLCISLARAASIA